MQATSDFFYYYIDVLEACNLRCPSCPQGNSRDIDRPKGLMSAEMLDDILIKAKRETPKLGVNLFSWTEPMLHPRIAEMVGVVKKHGLPCGISSNLNRMEKIDEVLLAGCDEFTVSLSGFYQSTYEQTHRGGNIETVKSNMKRLRESIDRTGSDVKVMVSYHRYKHNVGDDLVQMTRLVKELEFEMRPVWAYLMPLEKNLALFDGFPQIADRNVIELLALQPAEQKQVQQATPPTDCLLRRNQFTINCDGSVALCCAVFDKKYNISPSFLNTEFSELQKRRYSSDVCEKCMSHELHKTATVSDPELIDVAAYKALGPQSPVRGPQLSLMQARTSASLAIRNFRYNAKIGTRLRSALSGRPTD